MDKMKALGAQTCYSVIVILLYFHLFLSVGGESGNSINDYSVTGKIDSTARYNHTWTIKDFDKNYNSLYSPVFPTANRTSKWQLRLDYDKSYTGSGYYILYLYSLNCNVGITATYTLYAFDYSAKIFHEKNVIHRFPANCNSRDDGYLNFTYSIPGNQIHTVGVIFEEGLFINNYIPFNNRILDNTSDSIAKLKSDYRLLLIDSAFSDFVIEVEETKLHVHKIILAARSPVFSNILKNKTLDHIEVFDIDKETFLSLLEFIYTSSLPMHGSISDNERLLIAADKYKMFDLKLFCENQMVKNLATWNVVDIFRFANSHNVTRLKNEALKYIAKNIHTFSDIKSELREFSVDNDFLIQIMSQFSETNCGN